MEILCCDALLLSGEVLEADLLVIGIWDLTECCEYKSVLCNVVKVEATCISHCFDLFLYVI
jgi:hypothetical protein